MLVFETLDVVRKWYYSCCGVSVQLCVLCTEWVDYFVFSNFCFGFRR